MLFRVISRLSLTIGYTEKMKSYRFKALLQNKGWLENAAVSIDEAAARQAEQCSDDRCPEIHLGIGDAIDAEAPHERLGDETKSLCAARQSRYHRQCCHAKHSSVDRWPALRTFSRRRKNNMRAHRVVKLLV